jgi:hypothetical protein
MLYGAQTLSRRIAVRGARVAAIGCRTDEVIVSRVTGEAAQFGAG